jgi:predicted Zn-dependent protease
VLHGDGETEIDLPTYAFRNSAVHEVGHVLGLGHMQSEKGYLMSPQFDFWEEDDQLPITTLELDALVQVYGSDGYS